jgi:hypothetical protein
MFSASDVAPAPRTLGREVLERMPNATTGHPASAPTKSAGTAPADGLQILNNLLDDARETAREQLSAAWQIEIERIQEQLAAGWRGHLERVFDERFADVSARVQEYLRGPFRQALEERAAAGAQKARRDVSKRLNQAARRLAVFQGESEWARAVVDATEGFCDRAALFVVNGRAVRLQATRGIASGAKIDNTPLESAPAFAGAVETREPLAAVSTRGELSQPIAELVGESAEKKFYLFPISTRDRVAAILYSDGESEIDVSALELLTTVAALALDTQAPHDGASGGLVTIATGAAQAPSISSWFSLSKQEQELHLRAQRFARVQVAQMRLYRAPAVKQGRLKRDIYGSLRADIDAARDAFRREFLSSSPTMVDYIHVELLRTLANDDAELLGEDYPGPMA